MALIGVYADWEGLDGPERIGYLHSRRTRTREIFEFEYDKKALADPSLNFIRKRLVRTVLIFTESSDQLSRATDRVPGLPASPGYVQ
ncbi:HipA-like N-terminal domain family [Escherichia coli]|nr:HipA-like N-terminal domain family [Escherichia coli]